MKKTAIFIGALVLILAAIFVVGKKGGGGVERDRKTMAGSAESKHEEDNKPEVSFSAAPYIDYFNAKASADYEIAKSVAAVASSDFKWQKGPHKLVIKGREDGARLDKIWIGKVGEIPENPVGKFLEVDAGKLTPPMKIETIDGAITLIGSGKGMAIYEFEIDDDGVYNLWGRAGALDNKSDSFAVQVDGNPEFVWDVPSSANGKTIWTRFNGRGLGFFSHLCFSLSWAATSPFSKHRDDPELRKLALALTNLQLDAIPARKVSPVHLWFLADLETVYMWQQDNRTSGPVVAELMAKIKPSIEGCYKLTKSQDGWADNTPNIQIQSAAILRLASVMWQKEAPDISKEWAQASADCLERAYKWKLPESGFVYSYGSGFEATYVGSDAKFLGRYFMLTGDERAKNVLKDMASFAENTTSYGHPLSMGAPWWKHTFWLYNNGYESIPEIVLAVSKDPHYARMVELGRKRFFNRSSSAGFDPLASYYNMLLPDIATKVASIENDCFFSKIENGPALRFNSLNVAMPWRSWCESTCGAYYSTPEAVESQVCSVILTAVTRESRESLDKARYPGAYSIAEQRNPVPDVRAVICGKGFIASATTFRPALGGPALPRFVDQENLSPWLRTDIWFADCNGFAGALELSALQDNTCSKVALWTHVSDNLKIDGNTIKVKGLTITTESKADSKIANLGKVWGGPGSKYPIDLLETVLKESGTEGFKKGDSFNASVAVNVDGSRGLTVGQRSLEDGLYAVEILRGEQKYAVLLFNSSPQPKVHSDDNANQSVWQSKRITGEAKMVSSSKKTTLPPGSLTVLLPALRQ